MIVADLALALVVLTIPASVVVSLSGSPWILASLCFRREWRARYRKFARDVLGRPREKQHSSKIPRRLWRAVIAADRGICCFCRSTVDPQVDHGHPWSAGYLTWLPNLFVLCKRCNMAKGYKKGTMYELMEDRRGANPLRWCRALAVLYARPVRRRRGRRASASPPTRRSTSRGSGRTRSARRRTAGARR